MWLAAHDPSSAVWVAVRLPRTSARQRRARRPLFRSGSALMMVSGLIAAMIKKPDADLKSCVQEGYELGLKKHHNMIMKGVFAAKLTTSESPVKVVLLVTILMTWKSSWIFPGRSWWRKHRQHRQ